MCGRGWNIVLPLKETQMYYETECKICIDLQDKKTSKELQDRISLVPWGTCFISPPQSEVLGWKSLRGNS